MAGKANACRVLQGIQRMKHWFQLFVLLLGGALAAASAQAATGVKEYETPFDGWAWLQVHDGDYSATLRIDGRVKVWSLLGEPIINCYHRINTVESVSYKGNILVDVPKSVTDKIRVDFDAYLITWVRNFGRSDQTGVDMICQSGIDQGVGKWSFNFPSSPNWDRAMPTGRSSNQFNPNLSPSRMHYTDYANATQYLSVSEAKSIFKQLKKGYNPNSEIGMTPFPDYRVDLSAVRKWYEHNTQAQEKSKAMNQATSESLSQIDDLFSDIPEEQQARERDRQRQTREARAATRASHQRFQAAVRNKQRAIGGYKSKLSRVKNGLITVSKSTSDPRARYLALFKPARKKQRADDPNIKCYGVKGYDEWLSMMHCDRGDHNSRNCSEYRYATICVDGNNRPHGIVKYAYQYDRNSTGIHVDRIEKYEHGCLVARTPVRYNEATEKMHECNVTLEQLVDRTSTGDSKITGSASPPTDSRSWP